MTDLSLTRIETALRHHQPKRLTDALIKKRAAVAVVLRYRDDEPDVLLMKRAVHERDRWSGHVSFPGGRMEPEDGDLRATATRETHEELGVDLASDARFLGALSPVHARSRGGLLPLGVWPFAYLLTVEKPLRLSAEAESAFWLPLAAAARGEFDDHYPYKIGPVTTKLPCYHYNGKVVWGLTYQMLRSMLSLIGRAA